MENEIRFGATGLWKPESDQRHRWRSLLAAMPLTIESHMVLSGRLHTIIAPIQVTFCGGGQRSRRPSLGPIVDAISYTLTSPGGIMYGQHAADEEEYRLSPAGEKSTRQYSFPGGVIYYFAQPLNREPVLRVFGTSPGRSCPRPYTFRWNFPEDKILRPQNTRFALV